MSVTKYFIAGADISEVPNDYVYFHKDSIQPSTLWLAPAIRNESGVSIVGYNTKERYLKATFSGGSLPGARFIKMGRGITIT